MVTNVGLTNLIEVVTKAGLTNLIEVVTKAGLTVLNFKNDLLKGTSVIECKPEKLIFKVKSRYNSRTKKLQYPKSNIAYLLWCTTLCINFKRFA